MDDYRIAHRSLAVGIARSYWRQLDSSSTGHRRHRADLSIKPVAERRSNATAAMALSGWRRQAMTNEKCNLAYGK